MAEIVTDWREAISLLQAPVVAFDIETNTENYHWNSGDRGLAYPADVTFISFYAGPDLPTLVLEATATEIEYTPTLLEYDENDHPVWVESDYKPPVVKKCLKARWQELGSPMEGEIQIDEDTFWIAGDYKFGFISHREKWRKKVYTFDEGQQNFIRAMFERDDDVTFVAHTLVFDARQVFGKFEIDPMNPRIKFWDTLTIEILGMFGEPDSNDLLTVYQRYKKLPGAEYKWLSKMKDSRSKLHTVERDEVLRYVAWDSVAAFEVYQGQLQREKYKNFDRLLAREQEFTRWCVYAAARGMMLDVEYTRQRLVETVIPDWLGSLYDMGLDRANEGLSRKKEWLENYFFTVAGVPKPSLEEVLEFPDLITKRNQELLELKLKIEEGTAPQNISAEAIEEAKNFNTDQPGIWSFNKNAIKWYIGDWEKDDYDLEDCPYPELVPLARHKKLETLKDTLEEYLRHAEYDGCIHSLIVRKALTSRTTSSSPNNQNIDFSQNPGLLIARPGHCLLELDYSNAENWMQAGNGKDSRFALACAQEDFHYAMARQYAGESAWNRMTQKEQATRRKKGKTFTFGIPYGMGVRKLARQAGMTYDEAKAIVDGRKRSFPDVADATEWTSDFGERYGFVTLWSGRRCALRKDFKGKYKGYTGWNTRAQGGVGEMCAVAITRLMYEVSIVGYIHDALIVELPIEQYSRVQWIIQVMSEAMPAKFNEQTTPPLRWLVDLDNLANSKKWGYVHGREYPFPLTEYVNQWGTHPRNMNDEKAPVWINEWGWGQDALIRESEELGYELPKSVDQILAEEKAEQEEGSPDSFVPIQTYNWGALEHEFKRTLELMKPQIINGHALDFSNAMIYLEHLMHKGHGNQFMSFIEQFDAFAAVLDDYRAWRDGLTKGD